MIFWFKETYKIIKIIVSQYNINVSCRSGVKEVNLLIRIQITISMTGWELR